MRTPFRKPERPIDDSPGQSESASAALGWRIKNPISPARATPTRPGQVPPYSVLEEIVAANSDQWPIPPTLPMWSRNTRHNLYRWSKTDQVTDNWVKGRFDPSHVKPSFYPIVGDLICF